MFKRTEKEIQQTWDNPQDIWVSIACLAYNHEAYIKNALDGFLMQKTHFAFEILIHDDASTDQTALIIKNYAAKYPQIIKPIYQTENQYSKGIKVSYAYNFPRAKGRYIAMCEGDDYWTDSLKLQKQVDAMELAPQCDVSFHAVIDTSSKKQLADLGEGQVVSLEDIVLGGGGFCPTASLIFRSRTLKTLPDFFFTAPVGDYFLQILGSIRGGALYLPDVMAAYRTNHSNSWTSSIRNHQKNIAFKIKFVKALKSLDNLLPQENKKVIQMAIADAEYSLALLYAKVGDKENFNDLLKFSLYSDILPIRNKPRILAFMNKHAISRVFFYYSFRFLLLLGGKI